MLNPFPYSDTNRRFYTFDYYLRRRFGRKVFKVPLDGGFTCPNIDGSKGIGGCIYCSLRMREREALPLRRQFELHRAALSKKWPDALCIAYFQDFTNTYAPTERLAGLFNEALTFPDVVGLSIATRADCISDQTVSLLRELDSRTYLTVELGLQTTNDVTAAKINRCHTYADFLAGYKKLDGLNVAVHLIDGLPGEGRETMLKSAEEVGRLRPHEVKLHLLHVLRGTALADMYNRGELSTLTLDEYADIIVSQLELLPPETVIGRVTGDGLSDELIAPLWSAKKFAVMNEIDKLMVKRQTWQGKSFSV